MRSSSSGKSDRDIPRGHRFQFSVYTAPTSEQKYCIEWIVVDVQVQSRLGSFSRGMPKPSGADADWWMDKFHLDVSLVPRTGSCANAWSGG